MKSLSKRCQRKYTWSKPQKISPKYVCIWVNKPKLRYIILFNEKSYKITVLQDLVLCVFEVLLEYFVYLGSHFVMIKCWNIENIDRIIFLSFWKKIIPWWISLSLTVNSRTLCFGMHPRGCCVLKEHYWIISCEKKKLQNDWSTIWLVKLCNKSD